MNTYIVTINALIEDTCVLIAVAYLLIRWQRLFSLLNEQLTKRRAVYLGLVLGSISLTEAVFPGARYPYVVHTLIVTFGTMIGGLYVGLITAMGATLGVLLFQTPFALLGTIPTAFGGVAITTAIRRVAGTRYHLLGGLAAGMSVQMCGILLRLALSELFRMRFSVLHVLITIPANGFGVMILQLILHDAQVRAASERNRLEAQKAYRLMAEAQLTALRARLQPHFLFNTLTSIAGLCGVDPNRAEAAVVRLGQLIRRALETSTTASVCLEEEMEYVEGYLEIEQQRLGGRLRVNRDIDPRCSRVLVPSFSVQTLVENAIHHGIAPKLGTGIVAIIVRRYSGHALVAVRDDGVGMDAEQRRRALTPDSTRTRGLQILTQQLVLLHGRPARTRVFSRVDVGTLVVFIVPMESGIARKVARRK